MGRCYDGWKISSASHKRQSREHKTQGGRCQPLNGLIIERYFRSFNFFYSPLEIHIRDRNKIKRKRKQKNSVGSHLFSLKEKQPKLYPAYIFVHIPYILDFFVFSPSSSSSRAYPFNVNEFYI